MYNILKLISALFLLAIGIMGIVAIILEYNIKFKFIVTLVFSFYLIARGTLRIVNLIKSRKTNSKECK